MPVIVSGSVLYLMQNALAIILKWAWKEISPEVYAEMIEYESFSSEESSSRKRKYNPLLPLPYKASRGLVLFVDTWKVVKRFFFFDFLFKRFVLSYNFSERV